MADDRGRKIDDEEAEDGIRVAGRAVGLSREQIEDAIRDHWRIGWPILPGNIALTLQLHESETRRKGKPWDDAARAKAIAFGYISHVHGLVVLRAEIERRLPGGMETIEFIEAGERDEDCLTVKQISYGWPRPRAAIGRDGPFSAN